MALFERNIMQFEVVEDDSAWIVVARDFTGNRFLVKGHDGWLHAYLHASRLNGRLLTRFAV